MRRLILSTIAAAILSAPVSEASAQSHEIRGNLREWVKVFTQSPNEVDLSETRLKLELLSTYEENAGFRAIGYYVYDGLGKEGLWDIQQAYIDYYSDVLDVRFGRQVIAWGKADEINPTDILNPQDLSNLTEDKGIRKIGLLALNTRWKFYDFSLEGIWKPEFDDMELPAPDSRWAFFSIPGATSLPEPVYPGNTVQDTEWALKLSRTISLFDVSISYFDGWDNIPTPELSFDPQTQQTAVSRRSFHRTKMFGADLAGSIGSVGIWAEGAYFRTEDKGGTDPMIKNPYLQYVIGADYTFGYTIKVNVQYIREIITKVDNDAEKQAEEEITSKLGMGLPLRRAASFRIEKKFGEAEAHSIELFGIRDLEDRGILFQPKLIISPADPLDIEAGIIVFDGKEESIFGRFNRNDEVYLKCTYSF